MLIYTSNLWCNREDCAPPESRRYGAKSSGGMTESIRMDRGRGIYVHETDKKSIDELKRRKVDRRSVRSRKRVDRRQAGIASKDQIQQYPSYLPLSIRGTHHV